MANHKSTIKSYKVVHGASYIVLSVIGASMVVPLVWMVLTSLKRPTDYLLDPKELWPRLP